MLKMKIPSANPNNLCAMKISTLASQLLANSSSSSLILCTHIKYRTIYCLINNKEIEPVKLTKDLKQKINKTIKCDSA